MSSKTEETSSSTTPPPPPGGREHPAPHVAPTGAGASEDDARNPATEAFHRIKGDIDELKEYASYYVAAKVDGVKRTVRHIGLYEALGVVGLIAGGAIVATAAGVLIVGLGQGLSRLVGDRHWLGDIVTGIVVLALIGVGAWI